MAQVPTVWVIREGKRILVNESDLERFRAEGWAPEGEAAEAPAAEPAPAEFSFKSRPRMRRRDM